MFYRCFRVQYNYRPSRSGDPPATGGPHPWYIIISRFFFFIPKIHSGEFFAQLRWFALRGHQRLLKVSGLPAWCSFRGQPIPELVERRLRGRCMAIRAMQLGRAASSQRKRSAQSGSKREIR